MQDFTIYNVEYESRSVDITVKNGRISSVVGNAGKASRYIIPGGFMDLHCHGAAGYKTIILTREAYNAISVFLAQHGTTSFLATFSAAPFDEMLEYMKFASEMMEEGLPGARLAGVYMEGPCLNVAGAMNPDFMKPLSHEDLNRLISFGPGIIKVMAVAPEVTGAFELIELLAAKGITPAIGHSSATPEILREGIRHGLRHITHMGNNGEGDLICGNSCYRHNGPLLEMLTNDALTAEIITDGIHVAPPLVNLFYRAKGGRKCAAITDLCAAAGVEKERMFFQNPLGEMEEFTVKNGALYIAGTDQLTGSLMTMDKAFMNIMNLAKLSPTEAAASCGAIPRRIAGIDEQTELFQGMKDFTILSMNGTVEMTVADGKIIYHKKENTNE